MRKDFQRLLGIRSYKAHDFLRVRPPFTEEELDQWRAGDPQFEIDAATFRYDFSKKQDFYFNRAAIHFFVDQFVEKTTRAQNPWYSDPEIPARFLTRDSVQRTIQSHLKHSVDYWKIATGKTSQAKYRERLDRVSRSTRARLVSPTISV